MNAVQYIYMIDIKTIYINSNRREVINIKRLINFVCIYKLDKNCSFLTILQYNLHENHDCNSSWLSTLHF